MIGDQPRRGEGMCAMRGNCGKATMFGQDLPCVDDGEATEVTTPLCRLLMADDRRSARAHVFSMWTIIRDPGPCLLYIGTNRDAIRSITTSSTAHRFMSSLHQQLPFLLLRFHMFPKPIDVSHHLFFPKDYIWKDGGKKRRIRCQRRVQTGFLRFM